MAETTISFATMTAQNTRTALDAIGVTGEAQDVILRETAHFRHEARVAATIEAARSFGEAGGLSLLLLVADLFGVGGRDGVEGAATARHPRFAKLGTGRWHAQDGAAYRSAAEHALRRLAILASGDPPVSVGRVEVSIEALQQNECGMCWEVMARLDGADQRPWCVAWLEILAAGGVEGFAWVRTLTRMGLRASLGLPVHPVAPCAEVVFAGSPGAWASMVNDLQGRIAALSAPPVVVDSGLLGEEERTALAAQFTPENLERLLAAQAILVTTEDAEHEDLCSTGVFDFSSRFLGGAREATGAAVMRGALASGDTDITENAARAVYAAVARVTAG